MWSEVSFWWELLGSFILKWFEYLKQLLITFAWHAVSVELISIFLLHYSFGNISELFVKRDFKISTLKIINYSSF